MVHFEFSQTNAGTPVPPALQSPLPNVAIFSSVTLAFTASLLPQEAADLTYALRRPGI